MSDGRNSIRRDDSLRAWAPPFVRGCRAILLLVMLLAAASLAAGDDPPSAETLSPAETQSFDETLLEDAALLDVYFVDRLRGWAVGERGAIWATQDGGANWRRQPSGVSCRLSSVFFLDGTRGWVVGGASLARPGASRGVVLATSDAGQTWRELPSQLLPMLARVRFFDGSRGLAIGNGSSSHPTGVFSTQDGGQTWQMLPGDARADWLAGDFIDPQTGAVAGPVGRFGTIVERRLAGSPIATLAARSFHAMRLTAPTGGWLVGDGGTALTTADLGRSWQTPATPLPTSIAETFDFAAVAVDGPRVWLAGAPGTRVFHTPDGGQTWHAQTTGVAVPLRGIWFVDVDHGWAVGELGTILATRDGGQTWQTQRAGGRRAALLAVFARAADVPLEVLADQGAAEGYLAAVEILGGESAGGRSAAARDAVESPLRLSQRAREAMLAAGATAADTAWQFPWPPGDLAHSPQEIIAALDRENDGRALERLQRRLVRQIRMYRPNAIVTRRAPAADGIPIDPRAAIVEPLVLRAIAAAADPTQHVELAAEAGLVPWQVERVYGVLPPGAPGNVAIATGRFNPRLGATPADWTAPARRLAGQTAPPPDALEFDLLRGQTDHPAHRRGLLAGLDLPPGGDARRALSLFPVDDVEELRRLAARRRLLQELLERTEGNAAWAGQVANLTDGLDANAGGELLAQLAEGYRTTGQLDLAADSYYLLARRWPEHPLADQALVWLVQFYASSEAGHRAAPRRVNNVRPFAADDVQQASAIAAFGERAAPAVGLAPDDRLRRAAQLGEYLETARPALFAEPRVRFPLVAAQRQLGFANPAQRYFLTLRPLPESDPWRQCALTEQWLANPDEMPPPKRLGNCRPADERPYLDGLFDEPFWQTADVLRLQAEGDASPPNRRARRGEAQESEPLRPTVRLAYDREFLYVAIECPQAPGGEYPADAGPRPRDADLTRHDRVALRLDIDRDYTTHFELVVDHRGWTRETCWGDATWNPAWYVAAASDEGAWRVEAAIPLAELTDEPPGPRHVWAASIRRTIPRVGYETWAGPAAGGDSPEQYGLLLFE